jgi:hypothetical protein
MNTEQASTTMNLEIGRLVIDGLDLTPGQQRQLSRALRTSLEERFEVDGIPQKISGLSSSATLPVRGIQLKSNTVQPAALGRQIANSIYDGISKQSTE